MPRVPCGLKSGKPQSMRLKKWFSVTSPIGTLQRKIDGKTYTASYGGGDSVTFKQKGGGDSFSANVGKQQVEAMWLDDRAYGDLGAKLRHAAGRQP